MLTLATATLATLLGTGGGLQFGKLEIATTAMLKPPPRTPICSRHWLASSAYAHPLRIWNYLDAIGRGRW
ncbi:MAG: hypothetical protein U1F19_03450 [Lysobacterales bacterium]